MTTIPTDPKNQYGLWHPTQDGKRNGREAGQLLLTASAEQVAAMSATIEAGKAEAQQMLESRNICEVSIGSYHAAFYAEVAKAIAARGAN